MERGHRRLPAGLIPIRVLAGTPGTRKFIRSGAVARRSERKTSASDHLFPFGLGHACSLLAGFGMAAAGARSWVHMVTFALTQAVALYIVTDMEYPRLGLIRIDAFDHFSSMLIRKCDERPVRPQTNLV